MMRISVDDGNQTEFDTHYKSLSDPSVARSRVDMSKGGLKFQPRQVRQGPDEREFGRVSDRIH